MHLIVVRVVAVLFALSWLIPPGFGVIDLGVTWDTDWPVVLEASWGASVLAVPAPRSARIDDRATAEVG